MIKKVKVAALILVSVGVASGWIAGAQMVRKQNPTRGDAPGGVPQATFLVHRLGTDHAEGISSMDMNGDGLPDLLSGAYWYENPGPAGGEWKRHQYRTVGMIGEFVSDCGEWIFGIGFVCNAAAGDGIGAERTIIVVPGVNHLATRGVATA